MGGGLMQLVAYGAQDIYLTGNPQITFFKVVYRRHTNFSMEAIQQTISGSSTGLSSSSGTITISRNGDLVHKMYVNVEDAGSSNCTQGSNIVSDAELEIGGQMIDRHWSEWNDIWNELTIPESKSVGFKCMQGDIGVQGVDGVTTIQIPLNFWFCRNPGLALPLIALQYHEVKVKFNWGGSNNGTVSVWADYIYLDTDERRRFAQVSHEYLIEQIQKVTANSAVTNLNFNHPVKELIWTGDNYGTAQLKLNGHDRFEAMPLEYFQIRQPIDYHTAVPRQNLPLAGKKQGLATFDTATLVGGGVHAYNAAPAAEGSVGFTLSSSELKVAAVAASLAVTAVSEGDFLLLGLNTNTDSEITSYLAQVTDVVSETGTNNVLTLKITLPSPVLAADATDSDKLSISVVTSSALTARTSQMTKKINVYSFSLKPEEHQPSGTCNFSRIDTAQLVTSSTLSGEIYAINYNVLRIMSGMGGLAYSN